MNGKKDGDLKDKTFGEGLKDLISLARDMGINSKQIYAKEIIIKTVDGKTLNITPTKCSVSYMKGLESVLNFSISGYVTKGKGILFNSKTRTSKKN